MAQNQAWNSQNQLYTRVGGPPILEPEKICLQYGKSIARMVKNDPYYGIFTSSLCIQNPYYRRIFFFSLNKGSSNIPYGLGWVGCFTEMWCLDFMGNVKSVHPENNTLLFQYFITLLFHFNIFPSSYKCDIPIGKLSIRNKFYG